MRFIAKTATVAAALGGLLALGLGPARAAVPSGPGAAPTAVTPNGFGATGPIYATSYSHQSGTGKGTTAGGFSYVGWISNGDWIEFDNVNFFSTPLSHIKIEAAQWLSGSTEVHLDSLSNAPVATISGPLSGNSGVYLDQNGTLNTGVTGYHTVYLRFTTPNTKHDFLNVEWFQFSS